MCVARHNIKSIYAILGLRSRSPSGNRWLRNNSCRRKFVAVLSGCINLFVDLAIGIAERNMGWSYRNRGGGVEEI